MYDFIADIHGHADKLTQLLKKLGYLDSTGVFKHPSRKAIFVGDYIDRGPEIPRTLEIVKSMVESGSAIALMGNHEYNAINYHFENPSGGHLRKHSIKNTLQHIETLRQFQNRQKEYDDYINWFLTLPLFHETEHFRVVHACWDDEHIDLLKSKLVENRLTKELVYEATLPNSKFHKAVEETLKGKEMELPTGVTFTDKDGTVRKEIRIKWWEDPSQTTYKSYSIIELDQLPNTIIHSKNSFYSHDERPVFFGHYWLTGKPALHRSNICCVDYSVAKEGELVAYSWDEEKELSEIKFTSV